MKTKESKTRKKQIILTLFVFILSANTILVSSVFFRLRDSVGLLMASLSYFVNSVYGMLSILTLLMIWSMFDGGKK